MRNEQSILKYFKKFGREMQFTDGTDDIAFYGFLQPLRYKNKMYLNGTENELGYDNSKKYLLIAPQNVYFEKADTSSYITDGTKRYYVDHCEHVYYKNEPLYSWSIVHSAR